MPAIWEMLEAVGLSTTEACGDCPRVILGSPVAGIATDEIIDGTPAIEEINDRFIGDGVLQPAAQVQDRDLRLPGAVRGPRDQRHLLRRRRYPRCAAGFDLWVGGGLSTNPRMAERLGVWVPLDEVADVWAGVVGLFRDYGYRRLRHRARIKFLIADWGPEKFREVLEKEYLGGALPDGPAPELRRGIRDHVGVHQQQDGRPTSASRPGSAGCRPTRST